MGARVKDVWLPETALPPTREYHNGKPRTALFVPFSMEHYRESNRKGRETAIRNRTSTKHWTEEDVQKVIEMRDGGMTWAAIGKEFEVTAEAVRRLMERRKKKQQ